jgi:predicted esterase
VSYNFFAWGLYPELTKNPIVFMMGSEELPNGFGSEPETTAKTRNPPSRLEPSKNIAESSNPQERILYRPPQLDSLPENAPAATALTQVNVTDYAPPARQYTDSTTSTPENSFGLSSHRSSIAPLFNQPIHSQSSSEQQLQAARQAIDIQTALFEDLKSSLRSVPSPHRDQRPRIPVDDDLRAIRELQDGLSWKIGAYGDERFRNDITNIIIVLHDYGGVEWSLKALVKKHLAHSETAFLFLGGINRIRLVSGGQMGGLHWADDHPDSNSYHRAVRLILEHVISKVLIKKCNFAPCNIAILGHGQGGTVALAIAAVWDTTRLGGIITIDGPPPEYITHNQPTRSPTPVLIIGGRLGAITPQAEQRVNELFLYVDTDLRPRVDGLSVDLLTNSEEIRTAQDFLAHSLRQEEWETQAVLTFGRLGIFPGRGFADVGVDGGGIRGYGSLLILKELMRRIDQEERRLDSRTESSFYPGLYKPRVVRPPDDARPRTAGSQQQEIIASSTEDLQEADLFLPCHYFTYIGGTSTGGYEFPFKFDMQRLWLIMFVQPHQHYALSFPNDSQRLH